MAGLGFRCHLFSLKTLIALILAVAGVSVSRVLPLPVRLSLDPDLLRGKLCSSKLESEANS